MQGPEDASPRAAPAAPIPAAPLPAGPAVATANGGIPTADVALPTPRRVLVIDDELDGLTAAHFRELAPDFALELGDMTSPTAVAVWDIVAKLTGRKSFDATPQGEVEAFFASKDFVHDVLLSDQFRNAGVPNAERLATFFERADAVRLLREQLESAFSPPVFDLTFTPVRPAAPKSLLEYDFVIFDLVLTSSAAAVDELVKYLADLDQATYPQELPCLMVLSSRAEMVENRPRFSPGSHISAAGLLLLEKRDVALSQFGAPGLKLSYEQLDRQREVAQHMRVFVREWMKALDAAREAASVTLWNLDASAMQEIHLSAMSDDDPYDEHLNELVAREYLWHVETSAEVSKTIESLDKCFQAQFDKNANKATINERFIAPFVDPKPGRAIVSHYTWTGFALGEAPSESDKLAAAFNRYVPFGAVLAPPDLSENQQCWIHITQQCDLNSAVRLKKGKPPDFSQSAMFAVAVAMEVNDRTVPEHKTDELVARGLRVGSKEFDLKLLPGHQVAMPISDVVQEIPKRKFRVVGRLRHDIAHHFVSATANHLTRPASLKTTRVVARRTRIYIWGKGVPDGKPLPFLDAEGHGMRDVSLSIHNGMYYFQDDTCIWLALWIIAQLSAHFGKNDLEVVKVCNTLRVGLRDKQTVVSILSLRLQTQSFDQLDTFWAGTKPPDKPELFVFHENPVT